MGEWAREGATKAPLDWETVWSDERHGGFRVQAATRTDGGWERENLRLVMGRGDEPQPGAVCVCYRETAGERRVMLVRQLRPAPGFTLWELPRGGVDAGEGATAGAIRELAEEAGIAAEPLALLGKLHPDSGVLAHSVDVVVARAVGTDTETEQDDEPEVTAKRWCTRAEVEQLVRDGELRDAISLAALAMAELWQAEQA